MSNPYAKKIDWNGSKEDLLKLFSGLVDLVVMEEVIQFRNNNLSLVYEDLIEITNIPDLKQNLQLSSNEEENQPTGVTDSRTLNDVDWEHLSKNELPTNRILYLVSKGYKVMVIMRGCAGSGKSYQATNILNLCYKNANVDEFIFSADKFFINKRTGQYHYNRKNLTYAHNCAYEKAQIAVQREITPVIIDNTNTQAWEMENYIILAVNNGYWIEIIEPNTEWAWDGIELSKRNIHTVPYNCIMLALNRYERNITLDYLLDKFKLKYNKKNQPPKLSNYSKKYQLCTNLIDKRNLIDNSLIKINDHFKNLDISQKYVFDNTNKVQCTNLNNSDEDSWVANIIQEKQCPVVSELQDSPNDIPDVCEECQSTSSSEEASNYINKSVNTYENDFLFMKVLNEIPEEEYSSFVIFGINRDINDGINSILNISCGKLDKSTTTDDLIGIIQKPNLIELRKQFPENVCLLIIEMFNECGGDIDWIVEMLEESGYFVSKQQLHDLFHLNENNYIESIQVSNTIKDSGQNNVYIKQDNNLPICSQILQPKMVMHNVNRTVVESDDKEKALEMNIIDSKRKKLQTSNKHMDNDLKKNIENKFVFGDSLYSEHVLKIKKIKDGQYTTFNNDYVNEPYETENVRENSISEKNADGEFVQLVMDTSVLTQLCDYFGDFSSGLSKNTLPMTVKLPEKLAQDLYYCLIANVSEDIFDQEAILQDETLAKKLQENCKIECPSNMSSSHSGELTFAAVLAKKLLLEKFKNLDPNFVMNIFRSNEYKFQETSDILSKNSGYLTNQDSPDTMDNEKSCINDEHNDEYNYKQNFRQKTLDHAYMRKQYINKANQSFSTKIHSAVTGYYLDKAEESKQNEKHAKFKYLEDIINKNENSSILDLHFFPVQDAVLILDLYLDNHISNLKKFIEKYKRGRELTIITGRGKHSPKGIARIKPVVVRRLQARRLMYLEPEEPGLIMVIIKKNSLLSSQL